MLALPAKHIQHHHAQDATPHPNMKDTSTPPFAALAALGAAAALAAGAMSTNVQTLTKLICATSAGRAATRLEY